MKAVHAVLLFLVLLHPCLAAVSPDATAVSVGVNEFTFALFSKLGATNDGNVFCSPFSVSTALAMTYAGASGVTEGEMASVLGFGMDQLHLHKGYRDLLATLASPGGDNELLIANRLWAQKNYRFLPPFLDLVPAYYGAKVALVDFAQTEPVRLEINQWVDEKTRGKITDLIQPGMLSGLTRLVLANAIYFKGVWAQAFDPKRTEDAPFWTTPETNAVVPMMRRLGDYRYVEQAEARVIELPYQGDQLSMIVVVPKKIDGWRELVATLTEDRLDLWLQEAEEQKVDLWLPRFRMTSTFSLKDTLSAMGMPSAFAPGADFSRMTWSRELCISAVIHKAFVDVNEEGTEAAAATAVVMMRAVALPSRAAEFRADRPFVFLIRDNRTRTILFIGKVGEPGQE